MEVAGRQMIPGRPEEVWERLMDPAVLSRCIPGCKSLQKVDEGRYALEIELGVAAIKGSYQGEVEIRDLQMPVGYTLIISAEGPPGFVSAKLPIRLAAENGQTALTYGGEAEVGGVIAGVGQRVLGGVGKLIARQFFEALSRQVVGQQNG